MLQPFEPFGASSPTWIVRCVLLMQLRHDVHRFLFVGRAVVMVAGFK